MARKRQAERPAKRDLIFPGTLRSLRRTRFRSAAAFSRATGWTGPNSRGLHQETIGHYERGEWRPSEGLVEYMAQELDIKKGTADYVRLMAAAEHDRRIWDAVEAAAEAAAAKGDQRIIQPPLLLIPEPAPVMAVQTATGRWLLVKTPPAARAHSNAVPRAAEDDVIDIEIPPPFRPPRRPQPRRPQRAPLRVAAVLATIGAVLGLVLSARLGLLLQLHPALVAAVTPVVTETFTLAAHATATATPTRIPTARPTRVPTAKPTDLPRLAPTLAPTATPTEPPINTTRGTLTFSQWGPSKCDWNVTIKVWGFEPGFDLWFSGSAKGHDCKSGALAQESLGPNDYVCTVPANGTCQENIGYSDLAPIVLGSHVYDIYDYASLTVWQKVRLTGNTS